MIAWSLSAHEWVTPFGRCTRLNQYVWHFCAGVPGPVQLPSVFLNFPFRSFPSSSPLRTTVCCSFYEPQIRKEGFSNVTVSNNSGLPSQSTTLCCHKNNDSGSFRVTAFVSSRWYFHNEHATWCTPECQFWTSVYKLHPEILINQAQTPCKIFLAVMNIINNQRSLLESCSLLLQGSKQLIITIVLL